MSISMPDRGLQRRSAHKGASAPLSHRRQIVCKSPTRAGGARQRQLDHSGANQLDRDCVVIEHRVIELAIVHLSRAHDGFVQCLQLQAAK